MTPTQIIQKMAKEETKEFGCSTRGIVYARNLSIAKRMLRIVLSEIQRGEIVSCDDSTEENNGVYLNEDFAKFMEGEK